MLGTTGTFSVRSLYLQLRYGSTVHYRKMWTLKTPQKIRIFLWLVIKNRILTKDNLLKRGWTGDAHCHFCPAAETVDHFLFACPLARFVLTVVMCAFGLSTAPNSANDLMGNWISSFPSSQRRLVHSGSTAVI